MVPRGSAAIFRGREEGSMPSGGFTMMTTITLIFLLSLYARCAKGLTVYAGTDIIQAYGSGESVVSGLGVPADVARTCPRGTYLKVTDCMPCPRGRYGSTSGLTSVNGCSLCPAGTYNDKQGRQTVDDCALCPPGRYGTTEGLTTSACSGKCPTGKFSKQWGLSDWHNCELCPPGYRGDQWIQCDSTIIPRKGTFVSVSQRRSKERIH